jgi:cell division inhibitor SepF
MAFSIFQNSEDDEKNVKTAVDSDRIELFTPVSFDEAQGIADQLKAGRAVIVNLTRLDSSQAQRTIDFLTGIVYAIDGKIQAVGSRIILCNPKNMDVDGSISLE